MPHTPLSRSGCQLALQLTLAGAFGTVSLAAQSSAADRVRADITYLASDELEGRRAGEPGSDSAAAFIARRLRELQLAPIAKGTECLATGAVRDCFQQRFLLNRQGSGAGASALRLINVLALVKGTDSLLRDEFVVVGAHYDHLGRSPTGALDPEAKNAIRNGADDNASGSAAILELARLFAAAPARRSIVIAAFTAEELGQVGSRWFMLAPPVPLDSIVAMVNFDMVGRLHDGPLQVHGVGSAVELSDILDRANAEPSLSLKRIAAGNGPTDQLPFLERKIPVLHFFTGLHGDYHRASDDVAKIDVAGELRIIALAERTIRLMADRPVRLTPTIP